MQLVRTTLRLRKDLKKAAQRKALEGETTLQKLFNQALENFLRKEAKKDARKIVFKTYNFGEPLDNLTRDDFYPEPKV